MLSVFGQAKKQQAWMKMSQAGGEGPTPPTPPPGADGQEPQPGGPKWRRPLMVWVLLGALLFSLVGVFRNAGEEGGSVQEEGLAGLLGEKKPLSQLDFWQQVEGGRVVGPNGTALENRVLKEVTLVRESGGDTYLEGKLQAPEVSTQPLPPGAKPAAKAKPFRINILDTEGL